jgi:hypothetical protein
MQRKQRDSSEIAVDLQIGGEVWHRVASLDNSGPDDRHFVLATDEGGTTTVRFGDGAHGARLPAEADAIVAAYRRSKRFVAVVDQQGRVIVDNDWRDNGPVVSGRRYGVYRGIVTNNIDPLGQSRVQTEIADAAGALSLWAVPCRPAESTTVPAVGASVWVAFEAGDPARPVWMGVG